MKPVLYILFFLLCACAPSQPSFEAKVSCGQCQFNLKGQDGCDLAIKIDSIAYFVDGAHIDDFGDAHDEHTGFCEVVRTAKVQGELKGNRFQATSIVLID